MDKNRVIIVTDTTACVPVETARDLDIEIVPVVYIFGKETYRDGIDMTTGQFYEKLKTVQQLPTTSGALTIPYLDAFTRAAQKGDQILCINLSVKLSSMFKSASLAAEMAKEKLPGIKLEVIDTGTAAGAQGLIVLAAARAAKNGAQLPEVVEIVRNLMGKAHMIAVLDTLKYLVKGGRAPRAAAIAAGVMQIKPIIGVEDGVAKPVENVLTMRKAMSRLLAIVEQRRDKSLPLHIVVMHAGALEKGRKLLEMVKQRFNPVETGLWEFTPVMGVHTGPGLVSVAFYSGE
jgi:DegV family protein with EDD domain